MERKSTKSKRRTTRKKSKKDKIDELSRKYKIYLNQENPIEGEQFIDKLFPPDENSLLGKDTTGKYSPEIESQKNKIFSSEIEWNRSKKILVEPHLFEGEISTNNINTGIITNSYFISAVDSLCKFPSLISKIFITKEYNKDNCFFELLLFIDGEFQIIYLDDYFPCIKGTTVPYFTKPTTFELWFMLLEKAWAKVHGGYGNIIVGNPSEVFRFLTGFCTEQINHTLIDNKKYKEILKNCNDFNEILCFSTRNEEEVEKMGLIRDHNYNLCHIIEIKDKNNDEILLCKLKNPVPSENNWKGEWSDESDNWTDEVNKQINEDILETNKNEFFININDLLKYFKRTDVCHIIFNAYSKVYNLNFNETKNLDEPQIFNFYISSKGKLSISVSENNWKFHKELKYYSHPTSLVLFDYDPENITIKNIYSDFECDKDIEKTLLLNEGFYFLWVYKYFMNEENEKDKNMKIKILSEIQINIEHVGPDNNFKLIKQIIYEQLKQEKENLINISEIFHYISNEFKESGLAYRIAINPLSTCYQKWLIDPSQTKDFTIIFPNINPQYQLEIILEQNDYTMIIAIRNKKYGQFTFNTKIDAEELESSSKNEKNIKTLKDFDKSFEKNKNNLEQITTIETGSLEELSKKEEYPTFDHAKTFAEKYKKKYKLVEQVVEMDQDEINEKNKNLRWVKIKKENGLYLGEAEQNLPQGRGCFIYNGSKNGEGLKWVGYFDRGEKGNYGKLYNEEGRLIYEGEYKNGLRNGEGIYYYNGGKKYEGFFVNGLREGEGIFYWEDGTRWEGPFKNNEMNGEGNYYDKEESYPCIYKDGEIVEENYN